MARFTTYLSKYALVLFELTEEKKSTEKTRKELSSILTLLKSNPKLNEFLKSPVLETRKKIELFKDLFEKHVSRITLNFLFLLINNKRESRLEEIVRIYDDIILEKRNIIKAKIVTSYPLKKESSKALKSFLLKLYKAKDARLETEQDPEILGGIVIYTKDDMIDASVKGKLENLSRELVNK